MVTNHNEQLERLIQRLHDLTEAERLARDTWRYNPCEANGRALDEAEKDRDEAADRLALQICSLWASGYRLVKMPSGIIAGADN